MKGFVSARFFCLNCPQAYYVSDGCEDYDLFCDCAGACPETADCPKHQEFMDLKAMVTKNA